MNDPDPDLAPVFTTARLEDMVRGWFVGNFEPTLYKTGEVEVAIQEYPAGAHEPKHYHKQATEITVIVSGRVEMNGQPYTRGDMVVIRPNQATDFRTLEPTVTAVVKIPGASNDKFLVEPAANPA